MAGIKKLVEGGEGDGGSVGVATAAAAAATAPASSANAAAPPPAAVAAATNATNSSQGADAVLGSTYRLMAPCGSVAGSLPAGTAFSATSGDVAVGSLESPGVDLAGLSALRRLPWVPWNPRGHTGHTRSLDTPMPLCLLCLEAGGVLRR